MYSQRQESEDPDAELRGEQVPGAGAALGPAPALGEELAVARHEVAVAVDHLAAVVDGPAQAAALIQSPARYRPLSRYS